MMMMIDESEGLSIGLQYILMMTFSLTYNEGYDTSEGINALDLHAFDDDRSTLAKGRDSDRNEGINVLWR